MKQIFLKNRKIKLFTTLIVFLFFITLVFPIISLAADTKNLIPCTDNCGFNELMSLINNVISFILFKLAIPIAAISFAYAGFLLVTSGGNTERKSKAKSIFTNVALGLVFAVAAWLIVNTVLSILGYDGSWIGFGNGL